MILFNSIFVLKNDINPFNVLRFFFLLINLLTKHYNNQATECKKKNNLVTLEITVG